MKVKCKFLDKTESEIEFGEDDTVAEVKSKIQELKGGDAKFAPDVSKLIWKGKILANAQTAKDAGVNGKGFFVVMPGKPAAGSSSSTPKTPSVEVPKVAESSTPTPAVSAPATDTTVPSPEPTTPAPATTTTDAPSAARTTPAVTAPSVSREDVINMLAQTVQVSDELISNIVAIANTTAQNAKTAVLVAKGNADVAVELILSGHLDRAVEDLTKEVAAAAAGQQSQDSWQTEGSSEGAAAGGQAAQSNNPLAYLTNNPEFRTIMNEIKRNPAMLPNFLQQISSQNPQLFEQLSQNHESFLELLQDNSEEAPAAAAATSQAQAGGQQQQQQQPRQIELQISQADRQSIDQIMGVTGRSELEVVQAFMACEKNVNNTINFLFENLD